MTTTRALALGGTVVAVLAYYAWSATPDGLSYEPLTEAFANGRLDIAPSPHIDVTQYKGKHYLYYGIAPVVTVMLPWRLLTGKHLPAEWVNWIFVSGIFLMCGLILWRGQRLLSRLADPLDFWLCLLVVGVCNLLGCFLRYSAIYEIAIASACFWLLVAVYGIVSYSVTQKPGWLVLAGAAAGLAVGSRTSYIAAIGAMVPAVLLLKVPVRRLATAAAPFAVICLGLATYNYARFDSPLEFGIRFQQHGLLISGAQKIGLANITRTLYLMFCGIPKWMPFFPFFDEHNVLYLTHFDMKDSTDMQPQLNLFAVTPFALFGLAGLPLLRRRGPLTSFFWLLVPAVGAGLFVLLILPGTVIRYLQDFLPLWLLFSCFAYLTIRAQSKRPALVRGLAIASVLYGSAVCLGLGIGGHTNAFKKQNPAEFAAIERAFDFVPRLLLDEQQYGPLRLRLRFAAAATPPEPLVSVGRPGWAANLVLVQTVSPGVVRFFTSSNLQSQPVAVADGVAHDVEVDMGTLYPAHLLGTFAWPHLLDRVTTYPEPGYLVRRGMDPTVRSKVTVKVDGAVVLTGAMDAFGAGVPGGARLTVAPEVVRVGRFIDDSFAGRFPQSFSGTILKTERLPFAPSL